MTTHRSARTPARRRAAGALGLAVAGVLVLSACSGSRLGAAAVVDGRAISVDELQDQTNDYLSVVPGADPKAAQVSILQSMIVSEVLDQVAEDNDVHISPGRIARERDRYFDNFGGRRGLVRTLANSQQQPTVLPPDAVERWIEDRLLFTAIAEAVGGKPLNTADPDSQQVLVEVQDQLTKAGQDLDVEINPRYGTWNPKRGIQPLVSGGLATDAKGSDAS